MSTSVVVRHASYGIELVDALTGGPLVGSSAVTVANNAVEPFVIAGSRWIFEDLSEGSATFSITAEGYQPRTVSVTDVPAAAEPGVLARVLMTPRTGYPFPPTLTRIVGLVRSSEGTPVAGATVTITPKHGLSSGADVVVETSEEGQYTCWFLPDPTEDPPIADELVILAELGSTQGTVTLTDLKPGAVTLVQPIDLT